MRIWAPSNPRGAVVGVVVACLVGTAALGPVVPEEGNEGGLVGYAMDTGYSRSEAECMADGFEDAFGTSDPGDEDLDGDSEELRTMTRIAMACDDAVPAEGVSDDMEDCLVDASIEVFDLDASDVADARHILNVNMDPPHDERVAMTEAGLRCIGLSAATATCVVTRIEGDLPEYFDSPTPALHQREVAAIVEECIRAS
jgi:hypothetical protein